MFDFFVFVFLFILGFLLYFLPSFIAFKRAHASKFGILVLNFFLGWSGLFWILALVWALSKKD